MRVCLVGDGSSVHVRRWAADLRDSGIETGVLSYRRAEPLSGVEWQVAVGRPLLRQVSGVVETRRFLRRFAPDIVHLHYLPYGPRGLWPLQTGAAVVATPYGTDIEAPPGSWRGALGRVVVRTALRRADAVATASHHLLDRVLALGALRPTAERAVIGFGVDCARFTPPQRTAASGAASHGAVVIGYAKALEEYYGPMDLINAVASLVRSRGTGDVRLVVAGTGSFEARLRERVAELGLDSVVEFVGTLNEDALPAFYAGLDIFAMPSHREAYGVAALEAAATGVPVVATDVGGIPEAVADGETGLLVPTREPGALARALGALVDDETLRHRLGAAARTLACRRYPREEAVAKMTELYERVLGSDAR